MADRAGCLGLDGVVGSGVTVEAAPEDDLTEAQPLLRATPRRAALLGTGWLTMALVAASIMLRVPKGTGPDGDTTALIQGARTIGTCLSHGVLTKCNDFAHAHHLPGVSKFPLIQSVPALIMREIGLSRAGTMVGLRWLNFFVVLGILTTALTWCYRRSGPALTVAGGLLLVPGLLVAYSVQALSEPLGAAAFIGLVVVCLRRDRVSYLVVPVAAVATVSKETAAVFVVLFGLAAIALSGARSKAAVRTLVSLASGVVVGLVLDAGFNLFRYGTLLNHPYLSEPRSTHSMVPVNAAALLVSPNGGIAWFWPGVGVSIALLLVALVRRQPPAGPLSLRRLRVGAALTLVALGGYLIALGDWWDPMGWYAWGPRLLIPAAAPVVMLALATVADRWRRDTRLPLAVGAILLALSTAVLLPTLGYTFGLGSQSSMIDATFKYRPECLGLSLKKQPSLWESCVRTEEWRPVQIPLVVSVPGSLRFHRYWLTFAGAELTMIIWVGVASYPSLLGARPSTRYSQVSAA